jgi:hypothetical protein
MYSKTNGNPFPEKWTLICKVAGGKDLVEPRCTEDEARRTFAAYRGNLAAGRTVTSAYIIPPDGDGEIITLVGAKPVSV